MATQAAVKKQGEAGLIGREGKYLTFSLAGEEYGIGILKVKEIIGMMTITSVPQAPHFVKGVINLRGKVIPVTDLRLRFGLDEEETTDKTCIIVVEIGHGGGQVQTGIVVDSVSEVLNVKTEEIEDTPYFGQALEADFILGMAKVEGGVKILLDIDRVLRGVELGDLESMSEKPGQGPDGNQDWDGFTNDFNNEKLQASTLV